MIKKEIQIIKNKSKADCEKTIAFKLGKARYKDKDQLEIDVNKKTDLGWFFVHDGNTCFVVMEHKNKEQTTTCIHEIVEQVTSQACLDKIKELNLIYKLPVEV